MATTTYDPQDVSVIINGTYLTGFGEDLVEIEPDEDNYSVTVGAQGDTVRSKINNPLGTATLSLLPSSPQLALMNRLAKTGELVPVSIIYNGEPKETTTATEAFIKRPATRTYGTEAEAREFEIQMLDMDMS